MNAPVQSVSYIVSRNRTAPRGAAWAADLAASFLRATASVSASVHKYLQASSQARARAQLLKLADSYERTQPAFAAELRAASTFDAKN